MARSRTTFGPGNTAGAQPGNKLARRHGAYDPLAIEARLPAIRERIAAELDELPFVQRPDGSLLRTYEWLTARKELLEEWFDKSGGMWTTRGGPKRATNLYLTLVHRQQELAKVLGLGPAPRAQMAQAMAGASLSAVEVRAAQDRLRAKHLTS